MVGKGRSVRRSFSSSRASSGFSLVELAVVVVVLGIMASIALPAYNTFILQQRVQSATISLQTALVTTRSEAVRRNVSLTLSAASGGWNAGWSLARPGGGAAILSQPALQGISITGGGTSARFSGAGRLIDGAGLPTEATFTVSATEDSSIVRYLLLNASGRAVSCRELDDGECP